MKQIATLFLLLLCLGNLVTGQSTTPDSLWREYHAAKNDSLKWIQLFGISQYYAGNNPDSAMHYAELMYAFSQKNAPYLNPRSLNNIGLAFMNRGEYDKAISYYYKALDEALKYTCVPCEATVYGNISMIFSYKKEFAKEEEFGLKAIDLARQLKDTVIMTRVLNNLGQSYTSQGKIDKAEKTFQEALNILNGKHLKKISTFLTNNLGNIYYAKGDYQKAQENYQLTALNGLKDNDYDSQYLGEINSGWAYLALKKYGPAQVQFEKALKIAQQYNNDKYIRDAYGSLVDLFKETKNFEQALAYLEKYNVLNDTINQRLTDKNILELDSRFKIKESEARVAQQQLQLVRKDNLRNLILIGAILLIAVLGAWFFYLRQKERLRKQQAEIALQLEHAENEKLLELDKLKSNFFANISHEFRTPLTLLIGPLEQMIQGSFTGNAQKYYQIMHRNASRLLNLVNQLLDLSRLESGKMQLILQEGDIFGFLRSIAYSFESVAMKKQLHFEVNIPKTPQIACFDKDKSEKILTNLLSNAFKFTHEGGRIQLNARLSGKVLELEVNDNGIGIPPEELPHIFERFYKSASSALQEGSGIGMALTKELAELHGGTIRAESDEKTGTTFFVKIDLDAAHFPNARIEKATPAATPVSAPATPQPEKEKAFLPAITPALSDAYVLVVEDNTDVRDYICAQLKNTYKVLEAENGREGLELAIEKTPDLIITDVMMPEMDGIELSKLLKSNEKTSHIPIIMLTAKADQADKVEGLETGVDDYLVKPFDAKELQVRTANLIEQRRRLRQFYRQNLVFAPAEVREDSLDDRFLLRVREVVEANLEDELFSVVELSQHLALSRSQLHRKLKALTGYSPNEVIRNMRLERAMELLRQHTASVSEIAYTTGFNSLAYFSKCFKDYFGKSPSDI